MRVLNQSYRCRLAAPGNTPEAVARADAALVCLDRIVSAAATALLEAGWSLMSDPEDDRPAYLHKETSVRNPQSTPCAGESNPCAGESNPCAGESNPCAGETTPR
eukprot:8018863-Pyramimonas_sp.AAC.1